MGVFIHVVMHEWSGEFIQHGLIYLFIGKVRLVGIDFVMYRRNVDVVDIVDVV